MKSNESVLKEETPVWTADLGDGTYQNPILHADYSDPDVIRVKDDFFMVASSFNMCPCLPVLHSKDLVNWKIINHVFEEFPYEGYEQPRHGDGVWAPSIRYHDGKFWVFFGAPDEGIFMSTTDDPFGTWSPLHLVKEAKGWIDPCPFWDEDGQAYLVHAFAKSRIGFKSILHICKMKPDGTALLDEGKLVFDGNHHHPTIEGPKMYKRNGYYYIFAPAGGVATGWQTVLRSKNIYGPYEDKIVLHQGKTEVNGPHQGAWVELESGESWFLHFQDKGPFGRITHLQPMKWEKDWPVMGVNINENGIGEPVLRWNKPVVPSTDNSIIVPQTSDDFEGKTLGRQWQWRANINSKWYSLNEKDSHLRLYALQKPEDFYTLYDIPQIITQKFPAPNFKATAKVSFYPGNEEECCGLIVLGQMYSGLLFSKSNGQYLLTKINGENIDNKTTETVEVSTSVFTNTIYLQVIVDDKAQCQLAFSVDGKQFQFAGEPFEAKPGRWIGAQLGLFCVNNGVKSSSGYADFDWFHVELI